MAKVYTCAACGGTFESGWSDEEAEADALLLWGNIPPEETMVICDDCFQRGKDAALAEHHAGKVKN